jgi:DNA sulfur modification protein DndC
MVQPEIQELVRRGATFVVNHSGGKDSQAMFHYVLQQVPQSQIIVVHAVLPDVEWDGVQEHIEATTTGVKVLTCRSRRTLLQMISERGMFPSPKNRQCTSDLKRGPIERTIRATGKKLIVNCMGMRAQESSGRSKLMPFKLSISNSKAGREWYDWLPIHDWSTEQVFGRISEAGQKPHWAYAAGMSRLSCCFCIMSSKTDLTTAAKLNPALYKKYVDLEKSTGQVMLMPSKKLGRQTLEQVTGVAAS